MAHTHEVTFLEFIAPRARKDARTGSERRRFGLGSFWSWMSGETPERRGARERRATPRFSVEVECEERTGESRYFRLTSDLSTFGLSTRHGWQHDIGTCIHLLVYLPDGDDAPLEVDARVVAHYNEMGGMRLAFAHPNVDVLRRIHRFLSSRVRAEGVVRR